MTKRTIRILPLALIIAGCAPSVTEEQQVQMNQLYMDATRLAEAKDKQWHQAIKTALVELEPKPELGNCETDVMVLRQVGVDLARWIAFRSMAMGVPATFVSKQIAIAHIEEDVYKKTSPHHAYMMSEFGEISEHKGTYEDMSGEELLDETRQLTDVSQWTWDLFILIGREVSAQAISGTLFLGGDMVGVAYLYDHQQEAVTCVGFFDATSSERVDIWKSEGQETDVHGYLDSDLYLEAINAAVASLTNAGTNNKH